MLTLPPAVVAAIQAHVLAGYPGEACGLLFGTGTSAIRFVAMDNLADRLHAMDPVEYPRSSRDFYAMNEAKVARLAREAEAAGERWLAIVHSHIDCGAYFSAEDKRIAAPDGECTWPELFQVVVDVHADGVREAKAFRWDGTDFALVATYPDAACSR